MSERLPNHKSNFPPEWWDERRLRDYYIDENGCVQLNPQSETGKRVAAHLEAGCFCTC